MRLYFFSLWNIEAFIKRKLKPPIQRTGFFVHWAMIEAQKAKKIRYEKILVWRADFEEPVMFVLRQFFHPNFKLHFSSPYFF